MKQLPRKSRETRTRTSASTLEPSDETGLAKPTAGPSHEQIARRANELYVERGRQEGHDVEDWLRAESELAQGRG